jgi:DNA polymerase-3 subunit epsilon
MRQLIIDTETTGFSRSAGDRMVEFCALEMIDRRLTGNKLHLYFNPEREISPEVTAIHGLTLAELIDKPKFSECIEQINAFCFGYQWVIHNAPFDMRFLKHEYSLSGHELVIPEDYIIDTLPIARAQLKGIKHGLDALIEYYGLTPRPAPHNALIDCESLAEIYLRLTDCGSQT